MQLKIFIVAIGLVSGTTAACNQSARVRQDDLVGSYTYASIDPQNKTSDHEWDLLTLEADGHYVFVQGGPTKPRAEIRGSWTMRDTDFGPRLELDHAGYPIRQSGDEIRLVIDFDVGTWLVKKK